MISITMDIVSPSIDIIKDHATDGTECAMLRILNGDGSQILLHFMKSQDLAAFVGLQVLATGVKLNGNSNTSST